MKHILQGELPESLVAEARGVVAQIRAGDMGPADHAALVDLIARMTEAGLTHFFIKPLKELDIGPTLRGLVQVGLGSANKAIRMGLGRVIPKVKAERWPRIADFIEDAVGGPAGARK